MKKSILLAYLRKQKKVFMIFILFNIIYCLVFYLYNLPLESVIYSALLCIVLSLLFSLIDFTKYKKKHLLLKEIHNHISFSLEHLPVPKDLLEDDYIKLIETLFNENSKLQLDYSNNKKELNDYYTLWVHQIKTPISAMKLLLQYDEKEENMELLTELFKIEQYVEMVLQYLRLDSLSSDLLIKSYSIENIVKQAVRKYAPLFIRKRIHFSLKEIHCQVLTDEKWLLFVIEQLLSNALKYTPEEGYICIYMDEYSPKTLIIEDNGIGIAPEDLPRIFERGFTGFNGREDKKSTGIGLYLCKRILARLSHEITVESTPGIGTIVKLDLSTLDLMVE